MKDFLLKIWNWIVTRQADKLLHDYAGALIALYSFVVLFLFMNFWLAFVLANAIAFVALVLKEVYDHIKGNGHSVEIADIGYGVFGMFKIDVALIVLQIGLVI